MAGPFAVKMTVVRVRETCPNGHRVGEEHVVRRRSPGGICLGSLAAVLPYLTALRYGASFPWEAEEGVVTIGCPDHENCVVWRLERTGEKA